MKFTEIVAISGQSGLFKFIAQSNNGIIVESLTDGHRMKVSGSAKVSALAEITVYTETGDQRLNEIFSKIHGHTGGAPAPGPKTDPAQLREFMEAAVPDYDRDMVRASDIKKMVSWYNCLLAAGMTDFTIEEEPEQEKDESVNAAETAE